MTGVIKFTVVIATLMRPSLYTAVESVRMQYRPNMEIEIVTRYDPLINEYASRDIAICDLNHTDYIAVLDDDAFYDQDTLMKIADRIASYDFADCAVKGNIFGRGVEIFDRPYLGIGTALFFTPEAYSMTGGFHLSWGKDPGSGWRMDTALLYEFLSRNKGQGYVHISDVAVNHPNPMQSQWNPYIEWQFYREYQKYVEKYILPVDGRLPDMIKHADILDSAVRVLGKSMNDIILKYHRGIIVPQAYSEMEIAVRAMEERK